MNFDVDFMPLPPSSVSRNRHTAKAVRKVTGRFCKQKKEKRLNGTCAKLAKGQGVVYEVTTAARRNELISQGVDPDAIDIVTWITGEHFSLYPGN